MLLFVAVNVCLAVATVTEPPANNRLMANAQALLRIVLYVMFPALLLTAVIRARSGVRSFFIGGLFAALSAAAMMCSEVYGSFVMVSDNGFRVQLAELWQQLPLYRQMFAFAWLFIPFTGFACVLLHWLLRLDDEHALGSARLSRRQFALRLMLLAAVGVFLAAATVKPLPAGHFLANCVQAAARMALFIAVPAMLTTGAVQGRGYFKSFCLGCLLPSLVGLLTMCEITPAKVMVPDSLLSVLGLTPWSPRTTRDWLRDQEFERYLIIAMGALASVFGLTSVLCQWLLERGQRDAAGE